MSEPSENKWDAWDKIKEERYGTKYDIILKDEAPRIGNGFRIVYVKEGRKWAHMVSHTGDPDIRSGKTVKRLSLKKWYEMKRKHEQYKQRNHPDEVARKLSRKRYRRVSKNT